MPPILHDAASSSRGRWRTAVGACLLLVCLAYANHWTNVFHFDDEHTIVQNPNIRGLSNLPRLLTDATAASVYPTHAVYRPVTYVTLAVDYALAGGLNPVVFHVSTFIALIGMLAAVFVTCRRLLDDTEPHADNRWWALFAATLFGLHPVGAETVNYIIQRAELWSALGVVGSVALFASRPDLRRYGLYLVPGMLGVLAKTTASIFPFPILLYQVIVERAPRRQRWGSFVAALIASAAVTTLCAVMTFSTGTFDPGAPPAAQYRWTQPWIIVRYLRDFVLPLDLSIDPGWRALSSPFEARAIAGYACVALVITASIWLARRRSTASMAFGLAWFLVTLFPVSVFPLAEVTNDHRMFLPFVGLAFASAGFARWISTRHLLPHRVMTGLAVTVLVIAAAGTWQRNRAWATEEGVWRDAAAKNPQNGRALMNYGVALLQRGDYANALTQLEQATNWSPNYDFLEVNLGVVKGALGRTREAEAHFLRAIELTPQTNVGHLYYGKWLIEQQRYGEGVYYLERAVTLRQDDLLARHELMRALTSHRAFARLREVAAATLARLPGDPVATAALADVDRELGALETLKASARAQPSPERWLDLSLRLYNAGDFAGSIGAAREALALRADYAEAFNNIAAGHNALGQWNEGVAAAERALAIRPDFTLARNNLAWALSQLKQAR
jgi:tetratricopeptide (TPR) repeat protein